MKQATALLYGGTSKVLNELRNAGMFPFMSIEVPRFISGDGW